MIVPKIKFPICIGKPNGYVNNIERNYVSCSKLRTKDFTKFNEEDFISLFYKKLIMTLENMKAKIRQYLGYNASFRNINETIIQKAYFMTVEKKHFLEIEKVLYGI